ncbi:pantoate--beta-alanine ligase [Flavobacterium urocaniciphilum]|uniref:Pantothenate synthetase n=1 Tax=Flavobacterium urocaniciphilum TaxID=1299341 RepID=A0A1H9AC15_9FLAO|nr:pantoate--beta-alanine ligase [Flavobacterium urocaniciphilum]SEP73973.1 pantothenate synthetase [Flavobacterium urocaniciphilum]
MPIFYTQKELQLHLKNIDNQRLSIGFVPTMGALHKGHLSLMEQSLKENKITILSIFVNPTQFNNPEDLKKYPRTLENDVKLVEQLNKNIIIYAPSVEDIYEGNTISTKFNYDGLENQMEGKHRPGHFDGVGTIVKKLFEITNPTNAYFGEKDFQQLQIVKKLVSKYKIPVTIIGCPIHRETNGLAMSSRNERLSSEARNEAKIIYKILLEAKTKFKNLSANKVTQFVEKEFKKYPNFNLEYFEIADEDTLLTCKRKVNNKKYRGFIAVFIENVRLIDNISLK